MGKYNSVLAAAKFDKIRRSAGKEQSELSIIQDICDLAGSRVAELGCGTGFLSQQLSSASEWVYAFDGSAFMIRLAELNSRKNEIYNCSFETADHRNIPIPKNYFDITITAWTLSPFVYECDEKNWRKELSKVIIEMRRLTVKGGKIIILAPPWRGSRDYQTYIENEFGFNKRICRSSWRFNRRYEAKKAISFYFGKQAWQNLSYPWIEEYPVQTGVWWLDV